MLQQCKTFTATKVEVKVFAVYIIVKYPLVSEMGEILLAKM
jgi:hypothetical protein